MVKFSVLLASVAACTGIIICSSVEAKNQPLPEFTPSTLQTRRQTVPSLLKTAEKYAEMGEILLAIPIYSEAEILSVNRQLPASSWNTLCWYGSLWGYAANVIYACDKAVELAPDAEEFRDSRGVARALTGNIQGAVEDLQIFVKSTKDEIRKDERQGWINLLRRGQNPFTPEQLKQLFRD